MSLGWSYSPTLTCVFLKITSYWLKMFFQGPGTTGSTSDPPRSLLREPLCNASCSALTSPKLGRIK